MTDRRKFDESIGRMWAALKRVNDIVMSCPTVQIELEAHKEAEKRDLEAWRKQREYEEHMPEWMREDYYREKQEKEEKRKQAAAERKKRREERMKTDSYFAAWVRAEREILGDDYDDD